MAGQGGELPTKGAINLTIRLAWDGKSFEGEGAFDFVDADDNPQEIVHLLL